MRRAWRQERHAGLAVRRAGSGSPLLVLHDAGADTLDAPCWAALAADHDVVQVHLPGHPPSPPPPPDVTVERIADQLAALVAELGWPAATVAGTSLGGWFGIELALRHPPLVAALVLLDSAGLHWPQDHLLALIADGRAVEGTRGLLEATLTQLLDPADRCVDELPPAVATAVVGPFVQDLAAAAACSWHPATADPRTIERLPAITCPTLVLWGADDALIPLAHGRALADGIPGAALRIVPDAGHLLALDRPDVVADAVRELTGR